MAPRSGEEVVQAAYAAFRAGDVPGIAALCSADTDWTLSGRLPWAGTHQGPTAVKDDFFKKMVQYVRTDGFDTPVVMAGENPAWVFTPLATWTATVKDAKGEIGPDSPQIKVDMCIFMEVQDSKIVRYVNYCDTGKIERGLAKAGVVE